MRHLAICASIIVLLAACTGSDKAYRIGVSQCASGQWRDKANSEMLAAQHLYEQNAEVVICTANDDPDLQLRQMDSLVEAGIDLLVVAPAESAPIAEKVRSIRRRGIPVVFFDRKADTDDYTAFIGGNNNDAGRAMGTYALELAQSMKAEDGRMPLVLEVTAAMSTSPARERHDGFASVVQGASGVRYTCREGDWSSDAAYTNVVEQIETGEVPDIVFCHNDGMATGAYKAAVEKGLEEHIKILGIDGLPSEGLEYVQLGHQAGTYVYPTHGERVVKLALDILTGKPYERENSLQGITATTGNVDVIAANSREIMRQNHDLVTIHDKLETYFGLYSAQRKMLVACFISIAVLIIGFIAVMVAFVQTRKTRRQRQSMNEEQALFYTDAGSRKLHDIFDKPDDDLPPPRTQEIIFAEQLNEAMRKNMSNPNLKMDELGEEIGISRVQLYRKVKTLTGLSPVELLRQMRLQRAYALLQSTNKTIAEIAFEVGFNTPGYFSKCFRQQFGKYPTDLRQ